MTDKNREKPELIFFRETPRDWTTRPPLASSLQNLETSFLLIAMGRYPHALVSCVSAIESAIKAAFNPPKAENLEKLLERARSAFPSSVSFSPTDLDELRKKRNEIIHQGFSPEDDEITAILLLKTGYRLIEQCYQTFFQFPLKRRGESYGGLLPDLDRQLEIASKVYVKANAEKGLDLRYCFISFVHEVRWQIQDSMMSHWQKQVLDAEEMGGWAAWEIQHKLEEELTWKVFGCSWKFDCPVCRTTESFICELDEDVLDKSEIRLKRCLCTHCSLFVPKNCPFLADELCSDQLDKARTEILRNFGID